MTIQWDEETDVVVIGSGLAGLCAAIEAVEAGASVVVLEKMKVPGGNTAISDGGVAAPCNHLQKERGIEDSPQLFFDDMLRAGLGLNHPELVRIVAEKACEAIQWTQNVLGITYQDRLDRFGGHSVARCLTTKNHTGSDFIRAQRNVLKERKVEIRTGSLLKQLLTNSRGAVEGVQMTSDYSFFKHPWPNEKSATPDHENRKCSHGKGHDGTVKNLRARRAVILATGGFAGDVAFRMVQHPVLDEQVGSTNHRGSSAEGLIAALEINAAPVHLSWIQLGPWGCVDEKGYGRGSSFASYSVYPAGILVDPETGERIVNEWADRRIRCDAMFKVGHPCVGIVDAHGGEVAADNLQRALKRGSVKAFESLSDLAAAFGMPEDRLESTVAGYNLWVEEGRVDPLGKALFQGATPLMAPPFYAIRLWPKAHYTSGGVRINEAAQVIDLNGVPIPRLFAAGEVCGGIHGASRLGSCSLTECIVFGRIAGKEAAR